MHPKLEECKYHLNDTIKGRLCYISAHKNMNNKSYISTQHMAFVW